MKKLNEIKKPIYITLETVIGILIVFFSLSCPNSLSLGIMMASGIILFVLGIYTIKKGKDSSKAIMKITKLIVLLLFIVSFVVTPTFKETYNILSKENLMGIQEQSTILEKSSQTEPTVEVETASELDSPEDVG